MSILDCTSCSPGALMALAESGKSVRGSGQAADGALDNSASMEQLQALTARWASIQQRAKGTVGMARMQLLITEAEALALGSAPLLDTAHRNLELYGAAAEEVHQHFAKAMARYNSTLDLQWLEAADSAAATHRTITAAMKAYRDAVSAALRAAKDALTEIKIALSRDYAGEMATSALRAIAQAEKAIEQAEKATRDGLPGALLGMVAPVVAVFALGIGGLMVLTLLRR